MLAAVYEKLGGKLEIRQVSMPVCGEDELLVKVEACGVCRTDLHILDGDLKDPKLPLILGHEVVGIVVETGDQVKKFSIGDRVGIPWLGGTCGTCSFCKSGKENLCDRGQYTGYHRDGGFAEFTTCRADFAISLPKDKKAAELAPLLCAGLIGYRSFKKANPEKTIGFYGFGTAAHLLVQLCTKLGLEVYAFTRKGDSKGQEFAKSLGATWAGGAHERPPKLLDAVIHFAPVGELIPPSLKVVKKGGRCVCGGIHMSDIPSFPYKALWGEKRIESVANLTREDGREYFELLSKISIQPKGTTYLLDQINDAIEDFSRGRLEGAAVIIFPKLKDGEKLRF